MVKSVSNENEALKDWPTYSKLLISKSDKLSMENYKKIFLGKLLVKDIY